MKCIAKIAYKALIVIFETAFHGFAFFMLLSLKCSFPYSVLAVCIVGGATPMLFCKYHDTLLPLVSKKWVAFLIEFAALILVFAFIVKFGYLNMSLGLKPLLR